MDIGFWFIQLIIWAMTLALSVIPGFFLGSIAVAMFGEWCYWPGYIIGTIAFLITMRPILFLNKNIPVPPPGRRRSLIPFLFGLWIGKEILDEDK